MVTVNESFSTTELKLELELKCAAESTLQSEGRSRQIRAWRTRCTARLIQTNSFVGKEQETPGPKSFHGGRGRPRNTDICTALITVAADEVSAADRWGRCMGRSRSRIISHVCRLWQWYEWNPREIIKLQSVAWPHCPMCEARDNELKGTSFQAENVSNYSVLVTAFILLSGCCVANTCLYGWHRMKVAVNTYYV